MSKLIPVRVCRTTEIPLGGDLFGWIDVIWKAVAKNYESFGGKDVWDVLPTEVHLDHVIVQNIAKGRFFRADLTVNAEKETVEFSNIQRVVHQWVPAEDGPLEREEDVISDLRTVLIQRSRPVNQSLFRGLIR